MIMEHVQQVGAGTSSLLEHLSKALLELKSHKGASEEDVQWVEIEQHFLDLEKTLKKKLEDLEAKEREIKEKEAETCVLLLEREAAVISKEQDLLDRVQELKDAAIVVIVEARENYQPAYLESVHYGDNTDSKVSCYIGDTYCPEDGFPSKSGESAEGVALEIKPRPELTQFCKQMDSKGLLEYTMKFKKNIPGLLGEVSVALESSVDPARLVLDTLEGFYPPDENTQLGDERIAALQGMRKSCHMFIKALATFLARADPGGVHLLNPETKQQAKAIADKWKPKLGNSLEAEAFLQLLSTFRIASEFDEEELCNLVLVVAHRRQAAELCRSLGLTHKVPGILELLVNKGKHIAAVHFIHSFQLSENFPPVPILKAYLKDPKGSFELETENVDDIGCFQKDANAQERAALKAVIRCIEQYELESDYPPEPLQMRVAQLEKSKVVKKKIEVAKPKQPKKSKKSKTNGVFIGFRPTGGSVATSSSVAGLRTLYTAIPNRYSHAGISSYDYQLHSQPLHGQQASDQGLYYHPHPHPHPHHHPQDDSVSATRYAAAPPVYGGYMTASLQPPHRPFM